MAVEIEAPTQVSCPPHYWLIERLDLHHQHWTCQRCGAEQDHQGQRKLLTGWVTSRTSHRKAGSPPDSPA
jgi:hypothetical protein